MLSIVLVVLLYVVMGTVILALVPWQEAAHTHTIASVFIARTFADPAQGRTAAVVMTALILFITAASLYASFSATHASRSPRRATASSSRRSRACIRRSTFRTCRC